MHEHGSTKAAWQQGRAMQGKQMRHEIKGALKMVSHKCREAGEPRSALGACCMCGSCAFLNLQLWMCRASGTCLCRSRHPYVSIHEKDEQGGD